MIYFLIVIVILVPMYLFIWGLCRLAALPTPLIPDNIDQCWTCGKEIPPGPDFCTEECVKVWDDQLQRIKDRRATTGGCS